MTIYSQDNPVTSPNGGSEVEQVIPDKILFEVDVNRRMETAYSEKIGFAFCEEEMQWYWYIEGRVPEGDNLENMNGPYETFTECLIGSTDEVR